MLTQDEINGRIALLVGVVYKGLFPPISISDFKGFDEIIIDLDSIVSIVLSEDISEWKKEDKILLVKGLTDNFIFFLEKYIKDKFIKVYYNLKEYKTFTSIYPNWCKERQKRYKNKEVMEYVRKFIINKLEKLSEIKSNFSIIRCEDSPVIQMYKDLKIIKKSSIILSRDPHMVCLLAYYNITIFTGLVLLNRKTYYKERGYPYVHYSFIPAYYLIRGMKRNEYDGLQGYGQKKTQKLINENKIPIIKQNLPQITSINQYRKLFYLNEL